MAFVMQNDPDPVASARAYDHVVRTIRDAWKKTQSGDLAIVGDSALGRFHSCMQQLESPMANHADVKGLARQLGLPATTSVHNIVSKLLADSQSARITEVDDLTYNQFAKSVRVVAQSKGRSGEIVTLRLTSFLRACLDHVFSQNRLEGQLRVGANRHFPRLFQWLGEVAEESNWLEGQGLKIKNIGGHGPVAAYPLDPNTLKIAINWDWL